MNIFTQSDCSVYNLANWCTQYLFAKIIFEWCWTKRIGTEFNFRRVNPATGKMHFHGFAILAITWKSGFVGIEFLFKTHLCNDIILKHTTYITQKSITQEIQWRAIPGLSNFVIREGMILMVITIFVIDINNHHLYHGHYRYYHFHLWYHWSSG